MPRPAPRVAPATRATRAVSLLFFMPTPHRCDVFSFDVVQAFRPACVADLKVRRTYDAPLVSTLLQELDEQLAHGFGLLLLHPVSGALDQVRRDHLRARDLLHALERA